MKKIIAMVLSLTMILGVGSIVYGEYNEEVGIRINGLPLVMDDLDKNAQLNALIIEGRTMAPLRPIFDKFGLELKWNNSDSSISTTTPDGKTLWMQIDNPIAKLDGKDYPMDIGPKVMFDRTYIPVKYVFDLLGLEYSWDGENNIVNVNAPSLIKFSMPPLLKDTFGDAIMISEENYILRNTAMPSKICSLSISSLSYDDEVENTANKLGIEETDLVEVTVQSFKYKIFKIENIYSGIVLNKGGKVYSLEVKNMTNDEIEKLLNDL